MNISSFQANLLRFDQYPWFKIINLVASYATLFSLLFISQLGNYFYLILFFFTMSFIVTIYYLTKKNDFEVYCKNPEQILSEMKKITSSSGVLAILSRNLSWVDENTDIFDNLSKKSADGELKLYIQSHTPISEKLKEAGADIKLYESADFVPESRFTIMNFDRPNAKLALGFDRGGHHVIVRYNRNLEPPFHFAKDLISVLDKISKS